MDNKEHKAIFEGGTAGGYICADIHEGQLPKFLENAVKVSDMPQQQDMLLLSTLTACSWALPNIRLLHDKGSKVYYPNLMTMVVAPPASGKGAMANARRLIEPIDRVLQMIERRAVLVPDKDRIWDNRCMAVEEMADNAELGATSFRITSGNEASLYRGMLLREIR